jgi:RNA polymerase sigma-70 factor (family 1)
MQTSRLTVAHSYIDLFRKGEEDGFNHYFNAYYKPLHFFARSYIKDIAAAEDIIADSFIKLWHHREKFDNEPALRGYLYKTVYNACLRQLWQQQNRAAHHKTLASVTQATEQSCITGIIKAETIRLLYSAIQDLPTQCKTVFTKLYVEGKSVAETAGEMNLTISTIKNQKARGLKLLKLKLTP